MSAPPPADCCCICLGAALARGGEFLSTPGCCGAWFHQSCIHDMMAKGSQSCPICRTPFPVGPPNSAALPLPPSPLSQLPPQQLQQPNFQQLRQQPSPPRAPPSFWSRMFRTSRPSNATSAYAEHGDLVASPGQLDEDLLPPENPAAASSVPQPIDSTATVGCPLKVTITPEYSTISTNEVAALFAHVRLQFPEGVIDSTRKSALDVVCILDNSGSMDGGKIENLKKAMEFVVGVLSEKDRLSVIEFNSRARVVQGLRRMTPSAKTASRASIRTIRAHGGTDIYAGMEQGWAVLEQRRTRNAASCVFLLTDGQDGNHLEEKKALARSIRAAGCSLFLFGFGADHDSEHMNAIANAAEGSFVYVEADDQVVDAFGGAIGTQQGAILRDVKSMLSCELGAEIVSVRSGRYPNSISDGGAASVAFTDLFMGEVRDFLVEMRVASVAAPAAAQALLQASVSFRVQGEANTCRADDVTCSVARVAPDALMKTHRARDQGVDRELMRLQCTGALGDALQAADRGNHEAARATLHLARCALLESGSYVAADPVAVELLREIDDALASLASREEYERRGGRAAIQESCTNYSMQRTAYNKKSSNVYQAQASTSFQAQAKVSKSAGWF